MTDWRNRIIETRTVRVEDIQPHPSNWRRHPEAQESAIRGLLSQVGIVAPLVAYESEQYGGLVLLDGHLRQETGGEWPVTILDVTDQEADIILATFDPITGLAEMDTGALAELLGRVDMEAIEDDGLAGLLEELATASGAGVDDDGADGAGSGVTPEVARATLAERFILPPFSVLDARQGYWQERKRAWIALGIQSELGRGMTEDSQNYRSDYGGYSPNFAAKASPGGSPRDAATLGKDGKTQRGDGRGKPLNGGGRENGVT